MVKENLRKDNTPMDVLSSGLMNAVSDEYLVLIGRVATQWSILEVLLESMCWQAARVRNDMGRIITSQMQIQSKLDVLGALLEQTKPALAKRFKLVSNYIRESLQGQRNLVIHGHWIALGNSSPAVIVKYNARGKLVSQSKIYTKDELFKLAKDISEVNAWLLKLWQKLPALKQKSGNIIGYENPNTLFPQDRTAQKKHALQPLTSPLKSNEKKKKR